MFDKFRRISCWLLGYFSFISNTLCRNLWVIHPSFICPALIRESYSPLFLNFRLPRVILLDFLVLSKKWLNCFLVIGLPALIDLVNWLKLALSMAFAASTVLLPTVSFMKFSSTWYTEKNTRKNMNEVKTYIFTGLRYLFLLPHLYSADRKPGFRRSNFSVLKNLPSKWVMSLKKWVMRCQTDSAGSKFSCPQIWQNLPYTCALQFRHTCCFLSLWWLNGVNFDKNNEVLLTTVVKHCIWALTSPLS